MTYYPRIIFIDIEDQDRKNDWLKRINSLIETMQIKDFVIIKEIKSENDIGNLNAIMREMRGTNNINIPGGEGEPFNFINIVFSEKTDKAKITQLLNKIYDSTKFEEAGNVNLYILVSNMLNNINTTIPTGSLGQIIIQKKYEDGSLLKDFEYDKTIIDLLLSLTIISERQQFINHIFFRNPQNTVTIFPKLFTFPANGYVHKIREYLLTNVLVKIKEDIAYKKLSSEFIIPNELFQNVSININEITYFKNKPKIRIPLFAGQKKREAYIHSFIKKYDKARRDILSEKTSEIVLERNNPNLIELTKKIDESIYIKIKELLTGNFSFGILNKSLESLLEELKSEIDKINNWYFLQEIKIPAVDGRPIERKFLIPFTIVLLSCLGLLLINPLYSLGLFTVLIITFFSIGLAYLKELNDQIHNQISKDISTIKDFIEKNPWNFVSASKQYFIRRTIKVLANNIHIINKTVKRYEKSVDSFRLVKEYETLDSTTMKTFEKEIQNSIEEMISLTLKKHKQEILTNYKEPDTFFNYLLDNFYKSDCFKEIKNILFNLNKHKIESQLETEQKFAVSKEIDGRNIRIGNRKKILVSNIYKRDSAENIESADDYTLSILTIGIIDA